MSWGEPSRTRRARWLALLLVVLVAALFRLPGLGYPREEYFDEVYHAKTALQYLNGEAPTEWVHPPTAKLLIAVGVAAFGYRPWAWRLAPAIAGTLLAAVFLLLARRALRSERAALVATGLLLCDGVFLVQSRIAMTNVFAVLFQLLSALWLLRAANRRRLQGLEMTALGLALGLALSTRWTSLWAWGFLGLVFLALRWHWRGAEAGARDPEPPGPLWREGTLLVLAFALLPAALYLLSYVPWMRQGHDVVDVVRTQRDIWRYHAHLNATHTYFSPWWTWPLLYRPTWYFWWSGPEVVRGIVAIGNPALWWPAVPAAIWALVAGLRARDPRRVFIGAGFFFLYLPWGLSPRTLNFGHYLFEAIPYSCLALGWLVDRQLETRDRLPAYLYLAVVLALFLLFLPFLTAMPVAGSLWGFRFPGGGGLWRWFPSWI
jgi:dolichyl-phosphate-mannose--protein O-mannosyl transferase